MWSDASERYRTEIANIFSSENKLQLQMLVESKLAEVQASLGIIESDEALLIDKARSLVDLNRVKEIDKEIHHDLMSMVQALSEKSGAAEGKVHLGATSNDIQDTVLALQLQETKELLLTHLDKTSDHLFKLADNYSDLSCIARTHGQHAVPTTTGFKFANFLYELQLSKENLHRCIVNISKFSGVAGNYASTERTDLELLLLNNLGLKPTAISTQVVPRVIHAEFMNALALNASVLERITKEIRNLQRTEIGEWFEPFSTKQVGSSAMPHKRNPHKSERISGLARIIRGNVCVALENIALEHERELTHSSVERIIIPESANLLLYITQQMNVILDGLEIDEGKIAKNLNLTSGKSQSEQVLKSLVKHFGRQKGHEMLKEHMNSEDFASAVLNDTRITKVVAKNDLEKIFKTETTGLASLKTKQICDLYNKSWKHYRKPII